MRSKLLFLPMLAALGLATPSLAMASPYVNPDGSYPSYDAYSRDLNGVPCGIECRHEMYRDRAMESGWRRHAYYRWHRTHHYYRGG